MKNYKVDFQSIESKAGVSGKHLNSFEREVYERLADDPWDDAIALMDARDKLKQILSNAEYEAFILYANTRSQNKVAKKLKKSRSTIGTLINRAYKKIKDAGIDEFFG